MTDRKKMSITRGIFFGFGALLLLYAVYDIFSFQELRTLSGLTRTIHDHPLVVSNAALQTNINIIKIHRNMKDVVLFRDPELMSATLAENDKLENEVFTLLDTIQEKIIGTEGKRIASETLQLFKEWKPIRDEVIRLAENGQWEQAALITKTEGAEHVVRLETKMLQLTNYARNKASDFLAETDKVRSRVRNRAIVFLLLWTVIASGIVFFTVRRTHSLERELAEEKEKLIVTVRSIGDGVIATDISGQVILINRVAEELTGWSENEAIGQSIRKVFHIINEQTRESCENPVARVLEAGGISGLANHTVLISKDGTERPIADSGAPIRNQDEQIIGVVLVFRDQTEEREYQNRIMESEKKYRLLADNTLDVIWTMNLDLEFTYVNPAIESLTGYTPEEWVGSRLLEHFNEENFAQMTGVISDETAKGPDSTGIVFEAEIFKKNRQPIPVEIHGKVIYDDDGRPVGLQGTTRDISERKRAEEALRASEERYRDLYDDAPDMFVSVDAATANVLQCNQATVLALGYSKEEIIGRPVFNLYHPDCLDDAKKAFKQFKETGEVKDVEFQLRRKDGGRIDVSLNVSAVRDAEGRILHSRSVLRNITKRKLIEETLRKNEAQLKEAQRLARLGHWELDIATMKSEWSEEIFHIFGFDPETHEPSFAMHQKITHPDDWDILNDAVTAAVEAGTPFDIEFRIIRPDNEIMWMHAVGHVRTDAAGKTTGLFGTAQDITGHKQVEDDLEKLSAQLSSAVEMAQLGHWEYDVAGDLFTFNDQFYKVYRTTAEEVGGYQMSSAEYARRFVHPEDIAAVGEEIQKITQAADPNVRRQLEHRMIYADGTFGHVSIRLFVVNDASGQIVRTYGVNQDITKRKQAEEDLREQKERLANIIEGTNVGTWEWNVQTGETIFNERWAEIIGYKPEELSPISISTWMKYTHPDDLKASDEMLQRHFNGELDYYDCECRMQHKAGHWIWIQDRGKVISWTDDGRPLWMFGTHTEITERKRLEEELLRSKKLESVGILAGGIAHDFNNILATILGNVSLARARLSPQDEMFDLLSETETASIRAQALTRQLLTFAKGGAPLKETASIEDIIRESCGFVLRGSKSKAEFSIAQDLWSAEVDVGQMNQVINNIVINANQAMPEGGIIKVAAENLTLDGGRDLPLEPGRYIKISIKDQGAGISEKHLPMVFDPYFTTKQEGSGLGLATAYSIIKNHDGHIAVESLLGDFAAFHIYLPASDKPVPAKEEPEMIAGQGRILVMDDEEMLKTMLGRMLEKLGYEAEFASDGAEAIEMYQAARETGQPYDAVILDLTVPGGMGGKETIIKLMEIDPGVRAIVSSGYSDDPILANFQEYGFKGMIAKPFGFQSLGKALQGALQGEK